MAEGNKKDFPPDFKKKPIADAVSNMYAETLKNEAEEQREIDKNIQIGRAAAGGAETNPWDALSGSERKDMTEKFHSYFDGDPPPGAWKKFVDLMQRQKENFESGDVSAQSATREEIETFMVEQQKGAGSNIDTQNLDLDFSKPEPEAGTPPVLDIDLSSESKMSTVTGKFEDTPPPATPGEALGAGSPEQQMEQLREMRRVLEGEGLLPKTEESSVPMQEKKEDTLNFHRKQLGILQQEFRRTYPKILDAPEDVANTYSTLDERMRQALKSEDATGLAEIETEITAFRNQYFPDALKMAANPEDAPEHIKGAEGTPKEWREKLREAVGKVVEVTKEKFEWWKSSDEHFIRRNKELDAQAEKIGGVESLFRTMGEKYNKLGWKTKLAVGAGLGLGAALTAGTGAIAIPLALIAGQRIAGLSTMYLKFEKNSHQEKWGKEKAMLKAGIYTVLMGVAIKEAIEIASGTELAHAAQAKVEGWLGSMMGHTAAPPAELPKEVNMPQRAPDIPPASVESGAATVAANEGISVAASVPEMPSVEASAGHGYEWMMKRVWEQLQDKHLDPNNYAEGSDIRQLLEADPQSIDKIVHQIASNPDHNFFKPDGTSVRIDISSHLSINAEGQLEINGATTAPAEAPVTPAYHPETPSPAVSTETPPGPPVGIAGTGDNPFEPPKPSVESPVPETSKPSAEVPNPPAQEITSQSSVEKVDVTNNPELVSQPHTETVPVPVPAEQAAVLINESGLKIPTAEPHLYEGPDGKSIFAFGGTSDGRADVIKEYLLKNPKEVVFIPSDQGNFRLKVELVEDKPTVTDYVKTPGFLGFGIDFEKAPSPNDLTKLIK